MKKGIHPEFYYSSKVYCNGELVMETAGPQEKYDVEVWSGNHPFYQGKKGTIVQDEGQVESFKSKYGELDDVFGVDASNQTLSDLLYGDVEDEG